MHLTGQPVLHVLTALCLPLRASTRGPPPSDVASRGLVWGTSLRAHRPEGGPHQPPGGSPPLCMASEALQ